MRLGFIKDENGKLVRKFIRDGEERDTNVLFQVVAQFGDYIWTDEEHMEEAKEALLEHLFTAIRNLAKNDKFWLVKRLSDFEKEEAEYSDSKNVSLFPVPKEAKDGKCTLGWKFILPQMEDYYPFEERELIQKQLDACMEHLNN